MTRRRPQAKQGDRPGRRSLEPLRPRRVRGRNLVARRGAALDHSQPVARVRRHKLAQWRSGGDCVPRQHGQQDRPDRVRREQLGNAGEYRVVIAQNASKQRTPRKVHRQRRGQATQRLRRVLGRSDNEQRVRQASSPSRSSRGLRHRGCAGIYPDDQCLGLVGRRGQHVPAVAGA